MEILYNLLVGFVALICIFGIFALSLDFIQAISSMIADKLHLEAVKAGFLVLVFTPLVLFLMYKLGESILDFN